jgi:anti-sigma B factor antagonist
MKISTEERDGLAIVAIEGEIDSQTAPEAQEQLLQVVEAHERIVMDMGALTFMSSAGLRMMLLLYRQATAHNGKVAIVGLSDSIKDTMEATGFLGFFEVFGSIEEATTAVSS